MMKVRELLEKLKGVDPEMEVIVRVTFDAGDDFEMGGVTHARECTECTEVTVFMIDADEDEAGVDFDPNFPVDGEEEDEVADGS